MIVIKITCTAHNSPVVPAGEELHWIPINGDFAGVFELDEADLYCMDGTGDHEFNIEVVNS